MSFCAAQAVISNSSIGFSRLDDLNDPFEGRAIFFEDEGAVSGRSKSGAHYNRMSRNYALLSMTRTYLNPLMWSHYGDEHRGVVLAIDTDKAGLNIPEENVIPAKFGDVVYCNTMPKNAIETATDLLNVGGQASSFFEKDYELFKNAFLYKGLTWSYEEEVRIVKKIPASQSSKGLGESKWSFLRYQGRHLYCFSIPSESFVAVYLGDRFNKNHTRLGVDKDEINAIRANWVDKGIAVHQVRRLEGSWNLELKPE